MPGSSSVQGLIDRWLAKLAICHARRQFHHFLGAAHRAKEVQSHVLRRIPSRNADSGFGRSHGFSRIRSFGLFARQVPIQPYEAIQPAIKRVMAGEEHVLLGSREKVLMFAMSSGTTSEPKYVPVTWRSLKHYRRG